MAIPRVSGRINGARNRRNKPRIRFTYLKILKLGNQREPRAIPMLLVLLWPQPRWRWERL